MHTSAPTCTCKTDYIQMRDNYVNNRSNYFNMQHIYVYMQHNYDNVRDNQVNIRLKICRMLTQISHVNLLMLYIDIFIFACRGQMHATIEK